MAFRQMSAMRNVISAKMGLGRLHALHATEEAHLLAPIHTRYAAVTVVNSLAAGSRPQAMAKRVIMKI